MEGRDFITVARPPANVFEQSTIQLQASESDGVQGEYFDRMDYPEEGGIYAYFYDHAYPTKGQPYPQAVDAIQAPKKMIMGGARFIRTHFILSAFVFILPKVLTRKAFKSFVRYFIYDYVMGAIKPYCFLDEKRYCKSVKEIRRAGFKTVESLKTDDDLKDLLRCLLIMISNIFEWDNAHRYRLQDIFGGELNKELFFKNPGKEVTRLSILQVGRERGWHDDKNRWFMMSKALRLVLWLIPFVKHLLFEFVKEIDLDKVKMDEADEYHNFLRPDYDIHGWPIEIRQRKFIKIRDEYNKKNPGRFQEGVASRQRIESSSQVQLMMHRDGGVPFLLFFITNKEKNISQVKMLETKFSVDNPKLKTVCLEILQGKGKSGVELEKELQDLKNKSNV